LKQTRNLKKKKEYKTKKIITTQNKSKKREKKLKLKNKQWKDLPFAISNIL
jgi:hypothetical protein